MIITTISREVTRETTIASSLSVEGRGEVVIKISEVGTIMGVSIDRILNSKI